MDLILDTCALLSLAGLAQRKLSRATLNSIREAHGLGVSACSLFEISLKYKRGNLPIDPFKSPRSFWEEAIETYSCDVVPVEALDFSNAVELPDHHADPFDRIIIAQAQRLKSPVVTYDRLFVGYDVAVVS